MPFNASRGHIRGDNHLNESGMENMEELRALAHSPKAHFDGAAITASINDAGSARSTVHLSPTLVRIK